MAVDRGSDFTLTRKGADVQLVFHGEQDGFNERVRQEAVNRIANRV